MGARVLLCCVVVCMVWGVHGYGTNRVLAAPGNKHGQTSRQLIPALQDRPDISTCQQYTYHGQCQFYACLDQLFSCAGSKHKQILMHKFCNRAKHHSDLFSAQGLSWARDTNRCVMKRLVAEYIQGSRGRAGAWCGRVDKLARDAFVHCAATQGVCTALTADRTALTKIFRGGAWMTLVEAARDCPPVEVNQFIFWSLDQMQLQ